MPKVTVHGGASDKDALPEQEVEEWPGNSSPQSTEKQKTTSEQSETESQEPVPMTESPSDKETAEPSSVHTTGGSTPGITSSPAKKK